MDREPDESGNKSFDYANDYPRPKKDVIDTWIVALLALFGGLSAFLNGGNWNVIFSTEGAAVAGAMVGFIGSGVVLARAIRAWLEKRNG